MWPAFITVTEAALPAPNGKIVFDRVHVIGKLANAVDKVGRHEHKALTRESRC